MPKKYWIIRGYDGLEKVYERRLPLGNLSEKEITSMLKRLAAQHLSEDEIVSASLRKNAKGYMALLEVSRGLNPEFSIGRNPHYIAVVE